MSRTPIPFIDWKQMYNSLLDSLHGIPRSADGGAKESIRDRLSWGPRWGRIRQFRHQHSARVQSKSDDVSPSSSQPSSSPSSQLCQLWARAGLRQRAWKGEESWLSLNYRFFSASTYISCYSAILRIELHCCLVEIMRTSRKSHIYSLWVETDAKRENIRFEASRVCISMYKLF